MISAKSRNQRFVSRGPRGVRGRRSVCRGPGSGHRAVLRGRGIPVRGQAASEPQGWRALQASGGWSSWLGTPHALGGAGLRTGHVTCPVTGRCAVATQWRWVTAWATARGSLAPGRAAQLPRSTCWCLGRKGRRGAERQRGVVREGLPMPRHSACLQGVREPPGRHHLGEDGPVQRPGQGVAKGGSGLLREAGSGEGGPPESSGGRAGCGGGPGQEGTWPHGGPGFRSRGGGRPPEQRGQAALGII